MSLSLLEKKEKARRTEGPNDARERAKWRRIKTVYGLSESDYRDLDLGHCPICLRTWSPAVRPVVDHDHVERRVRGIVCRYCNHRRIGHHRDAELVFRIGSYLSGPFVHLMPPKPKKKRKKKVHV